VLAEKGTAYAWVFGFEAAMFVLAAACAIWVGRYDHQGKEQRHIPLVVGHRKDLSHEY
jgi:hypothetical protein